MCSVKRIGDYCSHDLDIGACGANNSFCDFDGVCKCLPGFVSRFHGENCAREEESYASESSSSSIGPYCLVSGANATKWSTKHFYRQSFNLNPIENLPPRCSCPGGYTTVLSDEVSDSPFFGARVPICQQRRIDNTLDKCIMNSDCPQEPGSSLVECDDFHVCRCSLQGHVANYEANKCGLPLNYGEVCTRADRPVLDRVCDGQKGLICGDPCQPNDDADEETCRCAPSYRAARTSNGSTVCLESESLLLFHFQTD